MPNFINEEENGQTIDSIECFRLFQGYEQTRKDDTGAFLALREINEKK